MTADIKFYISILWRRSAIILAIVLPTMMVTYFIAKELPTTYRTSARLLMEAPSIPNELTALRGSTRNQSRERLEVVQQRLLTRANLLEIAETNGVFPPDVDMSPDDVVRVMRMSTFIDIASGNDSATVMTIRFEGSSADLVVDVVNDYVTRILRADVQLRQGQARQTEEFFQQEVDRLSDELDIKSAAISAFRSENAEALPETFEFRLERLAALEERSADLTQQMLLLREQRRQLLDSREEEDPDNRNAQLAFEEENLLELRRELAQAMASGGETTARVRILQSRIGQVEQVIRSLGGNTDGTLSRAEQNTNELNQVNTRLEFLEAQVAELQGELDELEATLARTPSISIALADLERDYLNTQQQYNAVVERLAVAETTERIELMSRGERISILDPATRPDYPFKPNRKLVMAMGSFAGLMAALSLVLGFEFLNTVVKRPSTIEKQLGITPIATLPYIRSNGEIWRDRMVRFALLGVVFIGVPAIFWAVHTYYLPLDLLAERVLDRLGV